MRCSGRGHYGFDSERSITGLIRGVLDDARELIREEVALAKAEARIEVNKVFAAAAQFGGAAVAGWFALMFVLLAAALGVSAAFGWPSWAGFGLVGAVLAIVAAILFVGARAAARRVEPMPRTVESVKETFR